MHTFRSIAVALVLTVIAPFGLARAASSMRPADSDVLPFHTNSDGMPLIKGTVDNTTGVFLLDTGNPYAFLINRNLVPLEKGRPSGSGHFASGQFVTLMTYSQRHYIDLAGRMYTLARGDVDGGDPDASLSIDAHQQQKGIDAQLLGWIGYGFIRNYYMVLDYGAHTVTLVPLAKTGNRFINHNSLPLISRILFKPSSPVAPFPMNIGTRVVPAILDTAGWDQLALSSEHAWDQLESASNITHGPGVGCISIERASYQGSILRLDDLERTVKPDERLTLGFNFLHDYISVWDPQTGTVSLYANRLPERARTTSCS